MPSSLGPAMSLCLQPPRAWPFDFVSQMRGRWAAIPVACAASSFPVATGSWAWWSLSLTPPCSLFARRAMESARRLVWEQQSQIHCLQTRSVATMSQKQSNLSDRIRVQNPLPTRTPQKAPMATPARRGIAPSAVAARGCVTSKPPRATAKWCRLFQCVTTIKC